MQEVHSVGLLKDLTSYNFCVYGNVHTCTYMQEVSSYLVTEEQIEQDELNQHECMLPLMKLLDHMEHNKINPQVPKVNYYLYLIQTNTMLNMTEIHKMALKRLCTCVCKSK